MKPKHGLISPPFWAVVLAGLTTAPALVAQNDAISLVPAPWKMERQKGSFALGPRTMVLVTETTREGGNYLAGRLRASTGFRLRVAVQIDPRPAPGCIVLTTQGSKPGLGPEGYELEVRPRSVLIRAPASAGLFYGVQTLLQLFPPEIFAARSMPQRQWTAPCVRLEDKPRFVWRGFLLDVARHFFTKDELKELFDELALHKINTCQLHLTDDQGWRVPIAKHPRLTELGAWRDGIGFGLDPKSSTAYGPDGRYGGCYTREDIRELVAYARSRQITVVPEIEMPGHAGAVLRAYPELACLGGSGASTPNVYCAGNEETYAFVADVLAEVGGLFPGQYIHIGGDEVTKDYWKACSRCRALMRHDGLRNEHELQSYFIRRVEKILNLQGRRMIGWSEIREGGLARNATVMDWIGGAVEAASAGHDVIMTPTTHCYLDYYQARNHATEPVAIGGFIPLQTVYAFEPVPQQLETRFHSRILGAQGNVWTEYIASLKHVQYMTFPRECALAEVAWSPVSARNWDDFVRRLDVHVKRLEQLGINYRKGFFEK